MRNRLLIIALTATTAILPAFAGAKGCLKGAAVGAVAGHVAGRHAVIGAAAGCVIGHHAAKQRQREAAQAPVQSQDQAKPHATQRTSPGAAAGDMPIT